jgi:hypothetical protein
MVMVVVVMVEQRIDHPYASAECRIRVLLYLPGL